MSKQTLRDSHHKIIGYIETKSDGSQVGRDAHDRIKGHYDPKTNKTKDAHYHTVGTGNLLASLITSP